MNHAVDFKEVCSGYHGSRTLDKITLAVTRGQITGVFGPNGSGKTTLLRTILGLLPITSGSGSVLGCDLIPANYRSIRQETACAYQTVNVDPKIPVTAGEVVMMGRYGRLGLLRRPSERDRAAVAWALEQVDGLHLAPRPFGHLSGGEQQRINLARALAQQPRLLLLDEPTSYLDVESQARVRELIRRVHAENDLTTIIISHDPEMLADLCDSIIRINCGRVVGHGLTTHHAQASSVTEARTI